ncbi:MAG: energy transducer TonB [Bacteroidales bacterium]|nr:energy transducer TonB [Bacteroidales bacterium]
MRKAIIICLLAVITASGSIYPQKRLNKTHKGTPQKENKEKPKFQEGDPNKTFVKWVRSHIEYPKEAIEKDITGNVTVSFVVTKEGKVKDVMVIKSAHILLDKEAWRVVSSSPDWTPGKLDGKPVNVKYRSFPIEFKITPELKKKFKTAKRPWEKDPRDKMQTPNRLLDGTRRDRR